jgi:hypothetical protein
MMRPTLKTLWYAGGTVIATWLAVMPRSAPPATSMAPRADRSAVRPVTLDDLNAEEAKLRQHIAAVPLGPSTRNPFRFAKAVDAAPQPGNPAAASSAASLPTGTTLPAGPIAPAQPSFSLSGVAERQTPQGRVRTAIISGGGQLYLVTEGESVAGRYRVVTIDSDAVTLREENGVETRLVLQ